MPTPARDRKLPLPPPSQGRSRRRRLPRPLLAAWIAALATGCSGSLGHRSVAALSTQVPIGHDIRVVRLEIENGTLGVDVTTDPVLDIKGGVRRAADTAAELARLEAVPTALTGVPDPNDPHVLVVRGPQLGPDGPQGMLGYELGVRLPAELGLEIAVRGNGHVTVARRTGPVRVTTGRGDLRFENCQGGVVAKTGRGVVIAFGMGGALDIESAHGDMQVFVPQPGDLLRLRTGQGTIQCFLPKDAGFVCNARTETGRVGGAFGLHTESTTRFGMAMTGQHGDGRTKVVLMTGSGYIALQQHEGSR